MKINTFRRLKLVMELTFSDNDAEALSAIRTANRMLAAEALSWDRVLSKTVTVVEEFEVDPEPDASYVRPGFSAGGPIDRDSDGLEALLESAERAAVSNSSIEFVASVRKQWARRGRVSERQRKALAGIVERSRQ